MDLLWQELTTGFPDRTRLGIVVIRVIAAVLLGGFLGIERERTGKPAGFRTHMLVCLGTAVVVVACTEAKMSVEGLSRVVQGIVTGIGFIGAGSILKLSEQQKIKGLTTAAGLWVTAVIGVSVGLGALGLAVIATLLTLLVLGLEHMLDSRIARKKN
ncbi:MAG TPA: MgtC/SapB family protein [Pyrinomonadaceae bacterium]|jgi:putative Mg2+ transporter-C (MgtC) family protein|nr:MgtC/SapB family protein [Pyrinomonadaceae bacterium]